MTLPKFCSIQSRQSGIDGIGTAVEADLYVVFECPQPWSAYSLESPHIPENLRVLANELDQADEPFYVQFLLIETEGSFLKPGFRLFLLHQSLDYACRYQKLEFIFENLQDIAPFLRRYLSDGDLGMDPIQGVSREFLVCTHGSRDRCCARFGKPIYYEAQKIVQSQSLTDIQIWQASHIGGHRMAPTALDFPEGRYYGYLDSQSLETVLTRNSTQYLDTIYRGAGFLPWAAQVLEKQLLIQHGWQWLTYLIKAQVLEWNEDETYNRVELIYQTPTGERVIYQADIVADNSKAQYLQGSCQSQKLLAEMPYRIQNISYKPYSIS